jgi:hypothetical protein
MLPHSLTQAKPQQPRLSVDRFVLQSVGGLYFQSTPARPLLTKCRNKAREFDSEILADCFRECIELTARRSFRVFAVAGMYSSGGIC